MLGVETTRNQCGHSGVSESGSGHGDKISRMDAEQRSKGPPR